MLSLFCFISARFRNRIFQLPRLPDTGQPPAAPPGVRNPLHPGKHPAIVEDTKRQDELKRRRQATAEEHCRLLMRNIDELRQAETRDNDAQTKVWECSMTPAGRQMLSIIRGPVSMLRW